jgi:hypothetical protein
MQKQYFKNARELVGMEEATVYTNQESRLSQHYLPSVVTDILLTEVSQVLAFSKC